MPNRVRWLLVAVAAACCAAAPATRSVGHTDTEFAAHVEQVKKSLPGGGAGFTILIQKPFVVVGDDTPERVRETAERTVKWAVDHIKKDYFEKDPVDIIEVYLFKDKASYNKYTKELFGDTPETPYGYYSPAHKVLAMNIATGGGTLVHEIVHPFMAVNFPKCPVWFNEGLASLYEQSMDRNGHIVGLTNWRLTDLKETLSGTGPATEGKVPSFKDLCAMDSAAFYGPHQGPNYGVARYLLLYLQEKDALHLYYREFVMNQEKDPTGYETLVKVLGALGEKDMEAFRKKWEEWVKGLKYP